MSEDKSILERYIKDVPLFRGFNDQHLKLIIDEFKIVSVKQNADIVFQADEGQDFYIILKGNVKVSLLSCDGQELVLTNLGAGDFFGEMSLLDGRARSANVTAGEDSTLAVLKRDAFVDTMKHNKEISYDLLITLVERLRKSNEMIESLAFLDVNERLIKFISKVARKEGLLSDDGTCRVKKITHVELAANIGSSREAVSKALKVLAYKGAIVTKEGCHIISPAVLKQMEDEFC